MSERLQTCPNCRGHRGGMWEAPPCGMCEGSGKVSGPHARLVAHLHETETERDKAVRLLREMVAGDSDLADAIVTGGSWLTQYDEAHA